MPRVCPAINASRANPREQITGGRGRQREEKRGRERVEGKRPRKLIGSRCSSDVKLLCQASGDPFEGDSWTLDDRETVSRRNDERRKRIFGISRSSSSSCSILRVQFSIGILRDFARIISRKLSPSIDLCLEEV